MDTRLRGDETMKYPVAAEIIAPSRVGHCRIVSHAERPLQDQVSQGSAHLWRLLHLIVLLAFIVAGCATYESKPLSPARTATEFEARSLDNTGLRRFLETNLNHTFEVWPPQSWDFPTLTLVAFYYHPSLDLARAQWAVARAGVVTAGGKPNPVLTVTPGYNSNPAQGLSPWFPMVTIDVPIETAGKRRKRIARAGDLSESARLGIYTVAWQVRSQVRTAMLEWRAARQRAELLRRQLDVQEEILRLLEQRQAAGSLAATEVAPARLARLRTLSDLAEASRQAAAARVRLSDALGLPASSVASLELSSDPPLPPESAERLLSGDARNRGLQSRPDLLAALSDYAAAEDALRLEIARQYPDVHLSPGYQFDQGEHKWSLGISMELPLLNRNQGPIAEAEARRNEAGARFLALQAKAISEIDRAVLEYRTTREMLQNSEALLETQLRQLKSIQTAFQAGGADRFEVESAKLESAVAELSVLDIRNRIQQALNQLEDALQIPFDALPSVERSRDQAMIGNR